MSVMRVIRLLFALNITDAAHQYQVLLLEGLHLLVGSLLGAHQLGDQVVVILHHFFVVGADLLHLLLGCVLLLLEVFLVCLQLIIILFIVGSLCFCI